MGKNLIPIIANELGLEMEEKFRIANNDGFRFKFTPQDLLLCADDEEDWYGADEETIINLIMGDTEIIKLPFKPVLHETYWTYDRNWNCVTVAWHNNFFDFLCVQNGCVFRTFEEAYISRPNRYQELTGKEWSEDG